MRRVVRDPIPIENFGGLVLRPEPGQVGFSASIDQLNIEVARALTQVSSRGGLSRLGTGTASYHRIGPYTDALLGILRNTGSALQLETIALSGGSVSSAGTAWGGATTRATSTAQASVPAGTP